MLTLQGIAETLRHRLQLSRMRQETLRAAAGISKQTLTNVLSGKADYRLTTLLAVADKLGLELVLLPKGAAAGVQAEAARPPAVKSRVQAALDQVDSAKRGEGAS
ncbi:helix-turn-helix domain-containing protein [Variovorax sp. RA8]|uniref:helix-turn-helix domain-containing protein n=1 Tax=Variovorax sp. (strain JCM 16519 / RA8) TaxID=662548 RepID=UPI000A954C9C|nr:helix-turn-helix transcriptional regulator [Variovorax sp. RA8]VTU25951.1 transcriptional regulator, y4mF family [Variovorax sp. RA8]